MSSVRLDKISVIFVTAAAIVDGQTYHFSIVVPLDVGKLQLICLYSTENVHKDEDFTSNALLSVLQAR